MADGVGEVHEPVTERPLTVPLGPIRTYTFTAPGRLGIKKDASGRKYWVQDFGG